jgi:ABC-type phosphate transport system permease subunit
MEVESVHILPAGGDVHALGVPGSVGVRAVVRRGTSEGTVVGELLGLGVTGETAALLSR